MDDHSLFADFSCSIECGTQLPPMIYLCFSGFIDRVAKTFYSWKVACSFACLVGLVGSDNFGLCRSGGISWYVCT